MDIRSFFGKAPKGKSSGPAAAAAAKPKSTSTSTSKAKQASPEKKRKAAIEIVIDSDEPQDISPADFFAQSAKKSPKKLKAAATPVSKSPSPQKQATTNPPSSTGKKRTRVQEDNAGSDDDDYKSDSDQSDDTFDTKPIKTTKANAKTMDVEDSMQVDKPTTPEPKPSVAKSPVSVSKQAKSSAKSPPPGPSSASTPALKSTPTKPVPAVASKSPKASKPSLLQPSMELENFNADAPNLVPQCLEGLTFVFTGIMESLHRDEATELVKILGGRVTNNVSGKTSYLVVGEILEDGRNYTEGRKYKDAMEKEVTLVMGAKKFYGLCQLYQNKAQTERPVQAPALAPAAPVPAVKANPYAKKATNPYAKTASNPYAKKASNPYAAKKAGNPYASKDGSSGSGAAQTDASTNKTLNQLWVDRFAPTHTREILGNKENVTKLANWLRNWERTFNNPKSYNKAFSNPRGPWKAALLSGPPGIGKTTTATLVAKEAGRDLREFNASDARSKKALQTQLGDLTGSQSLGFQGLSKGTKQPAKKLRCVIMDEVDGMGAGDRSGMAELIQMIKKSKVPIICICNDRQSQKMKSLLPYCMDLRFRRPTKSIMANRAVRIAQMEGLQVERNAAEAIAESCGNDVRQVLNVLQMWAQKSSSDGGSNLTYKNLKEREKSINKDEILRVSLFDAAKTIMEGRVGLAGADAKTQTDSIYKRSDAFFVDYSLTGLLVHQNYLKIMTRPYQALKAEDNPDAEVEFLERLHKAADSMSDYAMAEHEIRSGDQNWSLLPTCGMMAVKTGYYAGGPNGGTLSGYPEFTAWMGKNSSKGKMKRLLNEMHHHMNFKISGDRQQLRDSYIPVLRERFLTLFKKSHEDENATTEAIALMDEYGLSREDVMEKLDQFVIGKADSSFSELDSKYKAAFTRLYNQGSHKSQALVKEEYGTSKPKKKGSREKDPKDLDAIDEDGEEEDSDGEDEEAELKKLQQKLKRKGRKGGSKKAKKKA